VIFSPDFELAARGIPGRHVSPLTNPIDDAQAQIAGQVVETVKLLGLGDEYPPPVPLTGWWAR